MKKVIMQGPAKSRIIEVEIPKIKDSQLLVKVIYTGLCHSEWYPWTVAREGEKFGHEPMGIVAEVGRNVTGFQVGDRVSGLGGGGFEEYIIMDPKLTVHVPDCISDEDAVVEPLSCLLSAASRVPVLTPGDSVAVVGAGYMGLGLLSLMKLKGAGRVVAIDPREEARERALQFGATEAYAPDALPSDAILNWGTMDGNLTELNQPLDIFKQGFRVAVEFTGVESGLQLAGDLVSAHGFLGVGGYHNDGMRSVDFKLWNFKSMEINNLHERRSDYQAHCCQNAFDLIAGGQWGFTGLSNHIYSLEEFDRGFNDMNEKPSGFVKGLIRCSDGKL